MPRNVTRDTNRLVLDEGAIEIPYDKDSDYSVTFTFFKGTTATTGLHWHEKKTECLQVLQGRALITVGDKTGVYGPDDGVITIPPYTLHEMGRADKHPTAASFIDTDLELKEWTSPPDRAKELFFRNLIGMALDRQPGLLGNVKLGLNVAVFMAGNDNYPVIWKGPRFLGEPVQTIISRWTTYLLGGIVVGLGHLCGFKTAYKEYTPDDLIKDLQLSL